MEHIFKIMPFERFAGEGHIKLGHAARYLAENYRYSREEDAYDLLIWLAAQVIREHKNKLTSRRLARKHGMDAGLASSGWTDPFFGPVPASALQRIYNFASAAAHHAFTAHPDLRA